MKNIFKQLFCRHDYLRKGFDISNVPEDPMESFLQELLVFQRCRKCNHTKTWINSLGIFWR